MSGDNMPANAGFYSSNKTNMSNDVKFKQKQEFYSCDWHYLVKVFLSHTLEQQKVLQLIAMCKSENVYPNHQHLLQHTINMMTTSFGPILPVPIMPILRSTGLKNEKLISSKDR